MSTEELGDRMKAYEEASRVVLPRRLPLILRIDGKAFHTYAKGCKKPFDENMSKVMVETTQELCRQIQGAQLGYTQSDEISILVHGYKKFNSETWFDNQLQKMVSVAAGIASATFTFNSWRIWMGGVMAPATLECIRPAVFDARAFVVPESDVVNYFIWRQKDASRNSMSQLARSLYSHKEINGKDFEEMGRMCVEKGHNWFDLEDRWTRGIAVTRQRLPQSPERQGAMGPDFYRTGWVADMHTPLFTNDREYVGRHLAVEKA